MCEFLYYFVFSPCVKNVVENVRLKWLWNCLKFITRYLLFVAESLHYHNSVPLLFADYEPLQLIARLGQVTLLGLELLDNADINRLRLVRVHDHINCHY